MTDTPNQNPPNPAHVAASLHIPMPGDPGHPNTTPGHYSYTDPDTGTRSVNYDNNGSLLVGSTHPMPEAPSPAPSQPGYVVVGLLFLVCDSSRRPDGYPVKAAHAQDLKSEVCFGLMSPPRQFSHLFHHLAGTQQRSS